MVRMYSHNLVSQEHRGILLTIARESIRFGAKKIEAPFFCSDAYPSELEQFGASFVTLKLNRQLKGCVGTLDPHRPLAEDVAENARSAAFCDPRFAPVTAKECDKLHIHISILTPPEELQFSSETSLLEQLKPNIDGVIIQEGDSKSTFLPSVWESLPKRDDFLNHLKRKAGWPVDYWSSRIRAFRYSTLSIE